MQNLKYVFLVFAFVFFAIGAALECNAPIWNRLTSAGLACAVAAFVFG